MAEMPNGSREIPILFSAPMVRALLAGRKTQTRRTLKVEVPTPPAMDAIHPSNKVKHPAPYLDSYCSGRKTADNPRGMSRNWCWWTRDDRQCLPTFKVRWRPGDRLWVRESWAPHPEVAPGTPWGACFKADPGHDHDGLKWRPSIHMPRWASRIMLEVTGVRIERLNSISRQDIIAEGINTEAFSGSLGPFDQWLVNWYASLWDAINGDGSWDANPWVVVTEFRRITDASAGIVPANGA